jgi:hypothetical protein
MPLYDVAIVGGSHPDVVERVTTALRRAAEAFGLEWETDFRVQPGVGRFTPDPSSASVVVVMGGADSVNIALEGVYDTSRIPAIPVASTAKAVANEIPPALRPLNCAFLDTEGASDRIASSILACVGLLPQQRRTFLSYRREASTPVAVQLFEALSERQFDVFLDTHSINVAETFQEALWHQLCDADVLVMLETDGYFASRWTAAEYGRALAKCIGVVRVTWPDATPNAITGTASRVELLAEELRPDGTLEPAAVDRILLQVEQMRVLSHAVRHRSLVDNFGEAVTLIGGRVTAVGPHRSMHVELATGEALLVQPMIGVPTSVTLHDAIERAGPLEAAILFDHLGIRPSWLAHLDWLATSVARARWVKSNEAAWTLAGWGTG